MLALWISSKTSIQPLQVPPGTRQLCVLKTNHQSFTNRLMQRKADLPNVSSTYQDNNQIPHGTQASKRQRQVNHEIYRNMLSLPFWNRNTLPQIFGRGNSCLIMLTISTTWMLTDRHYTEALLPKRIFRPLLNSLFTGWIINLLRRAIYQNIFL